MGEIVWILGAGFSRALGGPLLPDLLSRPSEVRIRGRFKRFSDRLFSTEGGGLIRRIVESHGWQRSNSDEPAWRDAEEFLEFLDLAAESGHDSPPLLTLRQYANTPGLGVEGARALAAAAKRLVAAECCFFSPCDVAYEKWAPYVAWASRIEDTDTVITFNYDRVVEEARKKAGKALDVRLQPGGLQVGPALLKLHGSVDWRVNAEGRIHQIGVPEYAVSCGDEEIAIASPGLTKARFVERLQVLWDLAEQAIKTAGAIVFVGYRFPPTDANARERLLRAISENMLPGLRVHTVLGPKRDEHTFRLEELLTRALKMGGRERSTGGLLLSLYVHPLFAEDFLGLASRKELLGV
jgi:hypothetical protein